MDVDRGAPLIGRDAELATIEEALSRHQAGFLLITGAPRMGKARMLAEVRRRAAERGYPVFPERADLSEGLEGALVDSRTTVEQFIQSISGSRDRQSAEEPAGTLGLGVVLVQGYHPTEWVDRWFTDEFLAFLTTTPMPRLVVLAGYAGDTTHLERFADYRINLGPLPPDAVTAWLASVNAGLLEPLADRELEVYAEAICRDPGILLGLHHLLSLETAPRAEATAVAAPRQEPR
ncbi:ATP-binding protein [Geodermatophilus sp. URMC 63]